MHDDAGVRLAEAADERREWVDSQGGQRHEIEAAGLEPDDRCDRRGEHGAVAQQLTGGLQERLARGREDGPAADPVEELDPELGLEPGHAFGQGGLGDVEGARGAGEPAVLHDADDVLDLAEFHRVSLWGRSQQPLGPSEAAEFQ